MLAVGQMNSQFAIASSPVAKDSELWLQQAQMNYLILRVTSG
jgi:hypothetical protein